jgi:hypothetical protein
MSEDEEVREIVGWFRERGIFLGFTTFGPDNWQAPMMREDTWVGSADYGVGKTKLEAAQDAKRRFSEDNVVHLKAEAKIVTVGTAVEKDEALPINVSTTVHLETDGLTPGAQDSGAASTEEAVDQERLDKIVRLAQRAHYRIALMPQPDKAEQPYAVFSEHDELMFGGIAPSWNEAWREIGERITPPSDEK